MKANISSQESITEPAIFLGQSVKIERKSKGIRCKYSVNYTGCKFSIRITEKEDKSWRVTGSNFASMKAQLLEKKPNTFQVDTTFDTKRENFTVFKSETTGR